MKLLQTTTNTEFPKASRALLLSNLRVRMHNYHPKDAGKGAFHQRGRFRTLTITHLAAKSHHSRQKVWSQEGTCTLRFNIQEEIKFHRDECKNPQLSVRQTAPSFATHVFSNSRFSQLCRNTTRMRPTDRRPAPERWVPALTESLTFYLSQSTDFTI